MPQRSINVRSCSPRRCSCGALHAYAQAPTGTISGRVMSSDGLPFPVCRAVIISERSRDAHRRHISERATTCSAAAARVPTRSRSSSTASRRVQRTLQRGGHPQRDGRRRRCRPPACSEDGHGRRRRAAICRDRAGRDQLQAEPDGALPSNRTIDAVLLMAPGASCDGPARRVHDQRLAVVRKPLHAQRRGHQREPPRRADDAVHRGRAAGGHRRQRRCVGRIRPVLPAASRTRSRSRAATRSADRSGRRLPTTAGARYTPFESTQLIGNPRETART